MSDDLDTTLDAVGPRLRAIRKQRGATLEQIAELTGMSISTLSRIESGRRRPTLEVLLPLARAYRMPLDELVGAPATMLIAARDFGGRGPERRSTSSRRPHRRPEGEASSAASAISSADRGVRVKKSNPMSYTTPIRHWF
jgi:transcriptional regulator with XRE-family HTH domain